MTTELTPLQKTQVAYSYFTPDEWLLLVKCVRHTENDLYGTNKALDELAVFDLLEKFPSVALPLNWQATNDEG